MKFTLNNKEIDLTQEEIDEIVRQSKDSPKKARPHWGYIPTEYNKDETMVLDGIKYHRHPNGGGWVSEKAKVDDTAWVGFFAVVHNGVIKDQAIIHERAVIDCTGLQVVAEFNIGNSAEVYGSAMVYGSARVYGSAMVSDSARVSGQGCLKKSTTEDIELKNWETIE